MSKRFTLVTVALASVIAFLVGAIFAGGFVRSSVAAGPAVKPAARAVSQADTSASLVGFADIVERLNPAVVNIDATARGRDSRRRRSPAMPDGDPPGGPLDFAPR